MILKRKRKDPLIVMPYGGFSNSKQILALARVLEDEGIDETYAGKGIRNVWNSFKRLETDEQPNVLTQVSWGRESRELVSDREGYVLLDVETNSTKEPVETIFRPIHYSLKYENQPEYTADGEFLVPGKNVEYGIISDIDDTILETGVISPLKWRLLVNTIIKNSSQRKSFPRTQAFYTQLMKGRKGESGNPFFYLSNSPWNIYFYLQAFMERMNFPKGVMLLRDIGRDHGRGVSYLTDSKEVRIEMIFRMYPSMSFVLIGDAAEEDAPIYSTLAMKYHTQVKAIIIRKVRSKKRNRRVQDLLHQSQVPSLLFGKVEEAVNFALKNNLILPVP